MKIKDSVFYTDNKVVRLETDKDRYYLTDEGKIYNMHPVNVMADEITGSLLKEVKAKIKDGGYPNDRQVIEWL